MRTQGTRLAVLALASMVVAGCTTSDDGPVADTTSSRGATPVAASTSTGVTGSADGITVTGSGVATGAPDVARITVGVEVLRDDVQQALDAANTATAEVLAVLDEQGIAEQDRQTRDFSIYPDQRGGEDGRIELAGYRVRNLVEATVRDVDAVGAVLQAAAEAAGDDARVEGVQFTLEDDGAQLTAAREAALADAREKAEQYAGLIGAELGEPVAVQETTLGQPRAATEGAADMADASVPIEPGAQDVVVQVTVRWTVRPT